MTKVVLFDLDETLFDHQYSSECAIRIVYSRYAWFAQVTVTKFEYDYSVLLEELWPQVLCKSMTIEAWLTASFEHLSSQYGLRLKDIDYTDMMRCYRDTYLQSRRPIAGALQLMEALKSKSQIGIITNHLLEEQKSKLSICKLDLFVDFLVCSGELGIQKPDQRIFKYALEQANCAPQEAVMVGDSWSSDILGASALGIRTIWLNRAYQLCPDTGLATEINSLLPTNTVANILLGYS